MMLLVVFNSDRAQFGKNTKVDMQDQGPSSADTGPS